MNAAGHRAAETPERFELLIGLGDSLTVSPLPAGGAVILGRGKECDLPIDSSSVSRRHARLDLGPPMRIQDLGSANGTFVCDRHAARDASGTQPVRRLTRESWEIAVGDRINLGSATIVVRRAAPAPNVATASGSDGLVLSDPAMVALYQQARRAAKSPLNVLILGETGVGKEILAGSLHACSPRAKAPYVEIHCASLPDSLLESELFGYEKGAFTGAAQARPGLIEAADSGTVLLDEIGELPLATQVKLLRVLEDRKVRRLGSRAPRRVDVRFVSATHRDLEAEIRAGKFRQDLFFRLNGISFVIPPLRARIPEIRLLAELFVANASKQLDRPAPARLSEEALAHLERHPWPGNVRELKNVIERAVALCESDTIQVVDLRLRAGVEESAPAPRVPPPSASTDTKNGLRSEVKDIERRRILEALERCGGNQTRAAKLLGISLRTLINRLDAYGVPRPRKQR